MKDVSTTLSVAGIALLWAWAMLGRRAYRAHTAGRLFAIRQAAVMQPFALLLLLAPVAYLIDGSLAAAVTGAAAGLAYVRYVALDPLRTGFWFHRRLRPIGCAASLLIGGLIGALGPAPAFAPLAVAALVFNRYLRLSVAITEQHLADLEAQRQKLLAHQAALHDSMVDKLPKAG